MGESKRVAELARCYNSTLDNSVLKHYPKSTTRPNLQQKEKKLEDEEGEWSKI